MHCVLLGVVRSLLSLWFDSKHHKEPGLTTSAFPPQVYMYSTWLGILEIKWLKQRKGFVVLTPLTQLEGFQKPFEEEVGKIIYLFYGLLVSIMYCSQLPSSHWMQNFPSVLSANSPWNVAWPVSCTCVLAVKIHQNSTIWWNNLCWYRCFWEPSSIVLEADQEILWYMYICIPSIYLSNHAMINCLCANLVYDVYKGYFF